MHTWQERHDEASLCVVPFLERVVGLSGARVLEFGAGEGAVAHALASHVASVVGLDIAADDIGRARERTSRAGLTNLEFHAGPFETLIDRAKALVGEVDLFVMYAVLEHMTLAERLETLKTAEAVVAPGGVLCVFETPNRLLWWDHHTSGLPFQSMLEPELAIEYAGRSPRREFADAVGGRGPDAGLSLSRWGRGVSQHEFELALGPLAGRIVAGGFEPELLPARHIHREELYLARFCEALPAPPAPIFSRYWLDLVLRFDETGPPLTPLLRPWPFSTMAAHDVAITPWETLQLRSADAWLDIPAAAAAQVVIGAEVPAGGVDLMVTTPDTTAVVSLDPEPGNPTTYATFALPGTQETVRLTGPAWTQLSFVGLRATTVD